MNFNPVVDFNGPVTTIGYEVTDINGETSEALIDINIIPTPDAVDDSVITNEDTPVAIDPLANDDVGPGAQFVTINNIPDPAVEGLLTYTDDAGVLQTVAAGDVLTPTEAATLMFEPVMDFSGIVPPINYTVEDINGETSDAQILIEVTPTPDAVDDAVTTNEDTPVALNPLANDDLGAGAALVTVNNIPDPAVEGTLTYTDADGNVITVSPGDRTDSGRSCDADVCSCGWISTERFRRSTTRSQTSTVKRPTRRLISPWFRLLMQWTMSTRLRPTPRFRAT